MGDDVRRAIIHVALVVPDYAQALEYYTKVLDFELLEDTYQPEQDRR
jgi:catechol 2,3-dioxygenase-like lactoylglutathione lyase family enzyme